METIHVIDQHHEASIVAGRTSSNLGKNHITAAALRSKGGWECSGRYSTLRESILLQVFPQRRLPAGRFYAPSAPTSNWDLQGDKGILKQRVSA